MAYKTERNKRLWNMKEYYAMAEQGLFENENVELINGEVYVKSPDGMIHRYTIAKINRFLVKAIPERFYLQPQSSFPLDSYSVPEPDIAVLEGIMEEDMKQEFKDATLVVEVSFSSLNYDRTKKMNLYARAGVPEYWIVNLRDVALEVYRAPDRERGIFTRTEILKLGEAVVSPFDEMVIPVSELLFEPDPETD